MKNKILLIILFATCSIACVQQAFLKTIIVKLTISSGKKDIKSVGIRGNGTPLSWDKDFELQEVIKDSVYTATIKVITAYKFGEVKFTVDGDWELKEKPNRRVVFNEYSDTTYYNAIFDKNL